MTDLTGRVALITGAGKGAGRLLAQAFAERGAIVAANDISPVNVDEVVSEILKQGGQAKAYIEDVAKKLGAQYIVKQVEKESGGSTSWSITPPFSRMSRSWRSMNGTGTASWSST